MVSAGLLASKVVGKMSNGEGRTDGLAERPLLYCTCYADSTFTHVELILTMPEHVSLFLY